MRDDHSLQYFERQPDNIRDVIPHSTPCLDQNDIDAITNTVKSGIIAPNSKAVEFENRIADYIGVKGCFVTTSGTVSLHLALLALGIKRGDKVLLPSLVCYAVLDAVNYVGLEPVFVDIEPNSYNISVKDIKNKLHHKPRVIIVPHIYGESANISDIVELGVPVIEDCCQALGGQSGEKILGSIGVISVFSFYATKIIATGSGGAVATNSESLLGKIREIGSNYYKNDYKVRYNYRMADLQASLGLSQLSKLDFFLDRRKSIAVIYDKNFNDLDVVKPILTPNRSHIFYRYMVRVKDKRDDYIRMMADRGIICEKPDYPLHRFAKLSPSKYPNTEAAYNSTVSIPIYPYLSDSEILHITKSFNSIIGNRIV